ncbi:hypothetical protein ACWGMA_35665 [Streptomyces asiaticus]
MPQASLWMAVIALTAPASTATPPVPTGPMVTAASAGAGESRGPV